MRFPHAVGGTLVKEHMALMASTEAFHVCLQGDSVPFSCPHQNKCSCVDIGETTSPASSAWTWLRGRGRGLVRLGHTVWKGTHVLPLEALSFHVLV